MELGGCIQDLHTGDFLMGVQVDCCGQGRKMRVFSNANGRFVFRNLSPGDWLLVLTKDPYRSAQISYVLTDSNYTGRHGLDIPSLQDEHVTA